MAATLVFLHLALGFPYPRYWSLLLPLSRCPDPPYRIHRYCRVPLSLHCHPKISALVISHSREATVMSRDYYQEYQNFRIRRNLLLYLTSKHLI